MTREIEIYDSGVQDGYAKGYSEGFEAGKDEGYEEGKEEGYKEGQLADKDECHSSCYDDGYKKGYDEGYDNCLVRFVGDCGLMAEENWTATQVQQLKWLFGAVLSGENYAEFAEKQMEKEKKDE